MRLARPLVLAVLLLLADAMPAAAQRIRLLLEGAPAPRHVPILAAVAGGHFAREGLDASVEAGLGANMATVLVGQRAFHLAHVSAPAAAAAISRGAPIRMVAIHQPHTALALVGLQGKVRLDGPRAVEGLRVGVAPATVDGLVLSLFRRAQGIGISAMTVIPTEQASKLTDLLAGRFDAVVGDGPSMRAALQAQGQVPEVMMLAGQGVALQGFGFIASQAMLDENPEMLRRGMRALRAGFAAAAADPAASCAAVRAAHDVAETDTACTAALRVFLETLAPPVAGWGRQSPETWLRMIEAMRAAGEVQGSRPPSFYYTNAVIP
jgi:NitT/TauT family transport system substrate-binding protein